MEPVRLGLRDASYPFDWLISEYSGVSELINNNFEDFLNYESQLKMLKSFCEENELILIAFTQTELEENEYTFCVENDENSTVSQEFCSKNKRLADLLCSEEIYNQ